MSIQIYITYAIYIENAWSLYWNRAKQALQVVGGFSNGG